MKKIIAVPNKAKNAFHIPSEYSRARLLEWFKDFKKFEIIPINEETTKGRRYLEGAIVPVYCHWQYGIDPRDNGKSEQRRFLFKKDFNYEIVKDRKNTPTRVPLSTLGKAQEVSNKYTKYAEENGAPIPNPKLYKLWRDKWSQDPRFPSFFEFLDFLELECDAMPSSQLLEKLNEKEPEIEYPVEQLGKSPF